MMGAQLRPLKPLDTMFSVMFEGFQRLSSIGRSCLQRDGRLSNSLTFVVFGQKLVLMYSFLCRTISHCVSPSFLSHCAYLCTNSSLYRIMSMAISSSVTWRPVADIWERLTPMGAQNSLGYQYHMVTGSKLLSAVEKIMNAML